MLLLDSSFTVSLLQTFTGHTAQLELGEVKQAALLPCLGRGIRTEAS